MRQAHVPAEHEPAEERGKAHGVQHVVDVIAVARTLLVADPRQGAVQAVAEPVQREQRDHEPQGGAAGPEAGADAEHRDRAQRGQVVRIDPRRQPSRHPHQQPFFGLGEDARVLPHHSEFHGSGSHAR